MARSQDVLAEGARADRLFRYRNGSVALMRRGKIQRTKIADAKDDLDDNDTACDIAAWDRQGAEATALPTGGDFAVRSVVSAVGIIEPKLGRRNRAT